MEKKKLDAMITDALAEKAKPVSLSPVRAEAMKKRICKRMKEESHMKKSMIKKVIIAAAAMCLLVPAAAVAGVGIASYSTSISNDGTIKTYDQIVIKAPRKLGFTPATVKNFANGFAFSEGYLLDVNAEDGSSNKVGSFPELYMEYKHGGQAVTLTASRPLGTETNSTPDAVKTFDGITVNYKVDHYKFVPEDYKLTQEDEDRMASGELHVSYGTDQVKLSTIPYAYWEQDQTRYLLMCSEGDVLGQADLMVMAKEVITSGK